MKKETIKKLIEIEVCSNCGNSHFIEDETRGENTCSECGIVMQENQFYKGGAKDKEYKSRDSGNPSYYDKDLGSNIGYEIINKISPKIQATMYRLQKLDNQGSPEERKFNRIKAFLKSLLNKINAERVVKDEAIKILRQFVKSGIRCKELDPIAAAIIYISYRRSKLPESLTEISEKSSINRAKVGFYVRRLIYELNIEIPALTVKYCIWKVSGKAGISEKSERLALEIIDSVKQKKKAILQGKNPWGFAAGALYLACKSNCEGKTQKEITNKAKVTEVTLRARVKEIKTINKELI